MLGPIGQLVAYLIADPGVLFDPGPIPYLRGVWSWKDFYHHFLLQLIQEGLLSVTSKIIYTYSQCLV